jgi:hypothetical protein
MAMLLVGELKCVFVFILFSSTNIGCPLNLSSLQSNSLIIISGRLLTGFAGTRVVARRYIADHVSVQDRLTASSQFVTVTALGGRGLFVCLWLWGCRRVLIKLDCILISSWLSLLSDDLCIHYSLFFC